MTIDDGSGRNGDETTRESVEETAAIAKDGMPKAQVRAKSLQRRDALPVQERKLHSQTIIQKLISLACYREAEVLLAYVNYRSEVETLGLIRQALSEDRTVFVPKVMGRDMEFYQITDLDKLSRGYRGILEPEESVSYPAYLAQTGRFPCTLLCMPGAAFDRARHRIGYGGGFYDRYLEKIMDRQKQEGLPLRSVALAYMCQVWEKIPWERHDVMPDILLTELGRI